MIDTSKPVLLLNQQCRGRWIRSELEIGMSLHFSKSLRRGQTHGHYSVNGYAAHAGVQSLGAAVQAK